MITARSDHLKAVVRDIQQALGNEPLDYVTVADAAPVKAQPSVGAESLGYLQKGDLVKGYPVGRWLYLDHSEVERLSSREGGEDPIDDVVWVLLDGAALGKGKLLEPLWGQIRVDRGRQEALGLSWAGLQGRNMNVKYSVRWQVIYADHPLEASGTAQVAVAASDQRQTDFRPNVTVSAPATTGSLQVTVVAVIEEDGQTDGGLQLEGAIATINFRKALSFLRGTEDAGQGSVVSPQDATGRLRRKAAVNKTEDLWRSRHRLEMQKADVNLDDMDEGSEATAGYKAPFDVVQTGDLQGRGTYSTVPRVAQLSGIGWWNNFHLCDICTKVGHEGDDEPLVRLLMAESSPPFILMELNSVSTFNMMDAGLAGDVTWAIQCIREACTRKGWSNLQPVAHVTSGAGPHFCPGGNPNPKQMPGLTPAQAGAYTNYLGFVGQRSTGCPTLSAGHGSMVGGGVAYALSGNIRGLASQTTIAFGNLSRGAVPGMHLSRTLPAAVGLSEAFHIYLADSTISAAAALKAQFALFVSRDVVSVKKDALQLGFSMARSPLLRKLPMIRDALPNTRFTDEATGINMAAATGLMFAAAKGGDKASKEGEAVEIIEHVPSWQELYADAALLHGPRADGGILAYAMSTTSRCWCTLESSIAVNKGPWKPKYTNKEWETKHAGAFNKASASPDFFPDATPASIEVDTVCEAIAWCMWRERCYSVGLSEQQGSNKISVDNKDGTVLLFDDPAEKFLGQDMLWFQYISNQLARNCTALTLAALIACIATPRVVLMFRGQEVLGFGRVQGKFAMHPGRTLTVEDVPNKAVVKVPSGAGLMQPHEWVFVRTAEQEWIIDICAAQFGDRGRSGLGVPLRVLTKQEARVEYIEVERSEDPLDAFDKFWAELVEKQKKALEESKACTEAETFLMVSGKICAMLGLLHTADASRRGGGRRGF
mmetsp:Transcript_26182/g.57717  ORF Transcript_26182/g.57717 Transcript_26182/m.57717 type:complete len:937 (+) Transcript_26182:90-2900(+)